MNAKRGIIVLGLLSAASMPTWAQQIKGVVIDQKSKETLIGAVVTVDGTNVKAITNIDGNFQIDGLDKAHIAINIFPTEATEVQKLV